MKMSATIPLKAKHATKEWITARVVAWGISVAEPRTASPWWQVRAHYTEARERAAREILR